MKTDSPVLPILGVVALCSLSTAQGFDPPRAVDINPASNVREYVLSANVGTWRFTPGIRTTVWAYSDDAPGGGGLSVPGPTLEAEVGDTLIVHFTNNLTVPTTIHWHGVELPAGMDGSHISQLHVQPGETFVYQFPILREGLYWYHPHVTTYDQVERGLHGCLLVKDPAKEAIVLANIGSRPVEEHIVVFDDVLLDGSNEIEKPFPNTDPMEHALYQLNGRVGNVLLVNGRRADTVRLPVTNGAVQRWHCVNVANSTICRLNIHDITTSTGWALEAGLWQLAADAGYDTKPYRRHPNTSTWPGAEHPGQALLAQMSEGILLFPGERLQVAFTPLGPPGMTVTIQQEDWFRGRHIAKQPGGPGTAIVLEDDPDDGNYPDQEYFTMVLQGPPQMPGEWQPNFQFSYPSPSPIGTLPVTFGHSDPDPNTGDVTLFAQAKMVSGQMVPLPAAKVDAFEAHDVNVGETWLWQVTNLTHGDHPFHIHGFVFELVDYEWQDDLDPTNPNLNFKFFPDPTIFRQLKDTIRIPARLGAKGTSRCIARLRTTFDDAGRAGQVVAQGQDPTFDWSGNYTSGGWLFHCHVLEHSGKGMLSFFEVRDPLNPFVLLGKSVAGSRGVPYLTGSGGVAGPVTLDLVNAPRNTFVYLISSNVLGNSPIVGDSPFVPAATAIASMRLGRTDNQGRHRWAYPSAAHVPGYSQALFIDPAAPEGWAHSNAVQRLGAPSTVAGVEPTTYGPVK